MIYGCAHIIKYLWCNGQLYGLFTRGFLDHRARYLSRHSRRLIVLKNGKVIRGHEAQQKRFIKKLKTGRWSRFTPLETQSGQQITH